MKAIEQTFTETEVVRAICKKSFFEFIVEFWDTLPAVDDPFIYNWHIEYLAAELQSVALRVMRRERRDKDIIINILPGSTKTILTCVLFPAWVWTFWPGASFIGVAGDYNGAVRSARFSREVIRSEKYRDFFPEVQISDDQDTKGYFANTQKGERLSFGVVSKVKGRHADFILCDDLFDPEDAYSVPKTEQINRFLTHALWDRRKSLTVSVLIVIMQRLSQNDTTGYLLGKYGDKIKHICIPGRLSPDVKPPALRKFYRNGLMDPIRHSDKVLDEARLRQGDYYYSGQIMQNPIPLGGGMFKTERISIEPPPEKWMKIVRYWDCAATQKGGAYTVGLKLGKNCDGRFWILDVKRGQWGPSERREVMKQTAVMDGKNVLIGIEQEPGGSGKEVAEGQARDLAGYRVILDRPTGEKALRADPVAAQVNANNVAMIRGDWNGPLLDELSFFPNSTNKDQADSLSGAFKLLTRGHMGFALLGTF